jgi:hypothetical protein
MSDLDVAASDRHERLLLGIVPLRVNARDLDVHQRDEVKVAAVEEVGKARAVALLGKGEIPDDPMACGLENDAFDS